VSASGTPTFLPAGQGTATAPGGWSATARGVKAPRGTTAARLTITARGTARITTAGTALAGAAYTVTGFGHTPMLGRDLTVAWAAGRSRQAAVAAGHSRNVAVAAGQSRATSLGLPRSPTVVLAPGRTRSAALTVSQQE